MASELSPEIIQAYRSARYKVTGSELPFVLCVDQISPELASLLKGSKTECAAFISVDNPQSQIVPKEKNLHAREAFIKEMEGSGLRFYLGVGEDPAGQWPGEQSFLILGLSLEMAKKLGDQYGQNAILWAGHEGKPELILLR